MQENMKKAQEQLAQLEVEETVWCRHGQVTMTCSHDVRRVSIDPSVMDDKEMLEDLDCRRLQRRSQAGSRLPRKVCRVSRKGLNLRPDSRCRSELPLEPSFQSRRPDRGVALPSGVGPKSSAAHGYYLLQHDRAGASALAGDRYGATGGTALRTLQYLHPKVRLAIDARRQSAIRHSSAS